MEIVFDRNQEDAIRRLSSGKILKGGTGIGKTLTALEFYRRNYSYLPLYVFTTSRKRDDRDFENEGGMLGIHGMCVDSWNKIGDYAELKNAFVIFDEQKAAGSGKWSKTFIKIAKNNKWVFTTATPGDNWLKLLPIFMANGFYKTRREFEDRHIEYDRYSTYPKIKAWKDVDRLIYFRTLIEIEMVDERTIITHDYIHKTDFNKVLYRKIQKDYWDVFENIPIETMPKRVMLERRIVATDQSRIDKATEIIDGNHRLIVFYNFNYEKDIIIDICNGLGRSYAEYHGGKHESIPDTPSWVYIVNLAACEAWNCITTDTCLFYSQNYAWWVEHQAKGRINRRNTKYKDLHYHILTSDSDIESAIRKSVFLKKKFNEKKYAEET